MRCMHNLVKGWSVVASLAYLATGTLYAQARSTGSAVAVSTVRASPAVSAAAPLDATKLKALKWRGIGPSTMSGRIADFAVARSPGVPDALYVAGSIGGVWKTMDWGATWDPVFDGANGASSIGSVRVAPSNPNLVWVGTGEADNRQSSSWGDGE